MSKWHLDDNFVRTLRSMVAWWRTWMGEGGGSSSGNGPARVWEYYGKMDEAVASTDLTTSRTMSIYYWDGNSWEDTTENLEVYPPPLLTSGSIASGKWVRVRWIDGPYGSGRWEVNGAEC